MLLNFKKSKLILSLLLKLCGKLRNQKCMGQDYLRLKI